jgi:thiamine-phosphate pyrophosphorylase
MEQAVYRIIDANFNRSREALRVMEEFCRFSLNSGSLTGRAKKMRHQLCGLIDRLDAGRLLAARDTKADVGVGLSVEGQMQRANLKDTAKAACKRLTEALRALSEVIAAENQELAGQIEALRFEAYNLEKDCLIFDSTIEKYRKVKLYIVISSSLPAEVINLTEKCIAGGADCIQLRAKKINDDELFALAAEVAKECKRGGVLSIINDRVDIAIAANADGVHLGQNDLPIEQAYKLQQKPLIIGKSTHSMEQLKAACQQPLTYVGLGPVYSTPTKPTAPPVSLEYVKNATEYLSDKGIGHVAIGGITIDNVEFVLKAGAKAIAVSSAASNAADPKEVCKKLKEKIETFLEKRT